MSNKMDSTNGFTKDSLIIPVITLEIPMPEGAAVPAESPTISVQTSPSKPVAPQHNAD